MSSSYAISQGRSRFPKSRFILCLLTKEGYLPLHGYRNHGNAVQGMNYFNKKMGGDPFLFGYDVLPL